MRSRAIADAAEITITEEKTAILLPEAVLREAKEAVIAQARIASPTNLSGPQDLLLERDRCSQ